VSSEVIIRKARSADHEELADITRRVFIDRCLECRVEEFLGPQGGRRWDEQKLRTLRYELRTPFVHTLVAEVETVVVGYLTFEVQQDTRTGWVRNLAVDTPWQSRGVGTKLLDAALREFGQRGLKFARIETLSSNEVARAFYRHVGFTEVAERVYLYKTL